MIPFNTKEFIKNEEIPEFYETYKSISMKDLHKCNNKLCLEITDKNFCEKCIHNLERIKAIDKKSQKQLTLIPIETQKFLYPEIYSH